MPGEELDRLLEAHRRGEPGAFERLVDATYRDLRALARRQRRRSYPVTLNTTALAHEAYLRLADRTGPSYADPTHFFAVIAKAMRHVLIDYARRGSTAKRGGQWHRVELTPEVATSSEEQMERVLAIDESLEKLADLDPQLVQVVECRYFAGLTEAETASALGISVSTVQRHWRLARAKLRLALEAPR